MAKVVAAGDLWALEEGKRTILSGGVVAFPTDTVYGVGASAYLPGAVARLYRLKGRPPDKPIAVLLADAGEMAGVVGDIPEAAWKLAERFWPGALTLVLPRRAHIPAAVSAGRDTIAVRVPDHPVARALIRAAGVPLATTSANLSAREPALTAEEVEEALGALVDLIIDGGRAPGGVPSTVLDLTLPAPTILRPGALPAEELAQVLGKVPALSP